MKIHIKNLMFKIGLILGLSGIIFFALGLFCINSLFDRIMLLACAILLFAVGGLYVYLENHDDRKTNANMFLFNPLTGRERHVSELNFRNICDALDLYIPVYVYANTGDTWFDKSITTKYSNFKNNLIIKLIYYRLLYIWIDEADDNDYRRFGSLSKEDVDYLVDFMSDMGEHEISSKLKNLCNIYDGNIHELRTFFMSKKEYLERAIVDFVIENIDEF